jgi:predicted DNA-binding transcriptional regulator AlpA
MTDPALASSEAAMTSSSDQAGHDAFAELPLLIPVPRAAQILGISRAAAYRFASTGDLPTKRLGRRVYVVAARLREFIDAESPAA